MKHGGHFSDGAIRSTIGSKALIRETFDAAEREKYIEEMHQRSRSGDKNEYKNILIVLVSLLLLVTVNAIAFDDVDTHPAITDEKGFWTIREF